MAIFLKGLSIPQKQRGARLGAPLDLAEIGGKPGD
jgi:hypothetical protein